MKRIIETIIKILAFLIAFAIATGFYFKFQEDHLIGDRIIGIAVLASAFILLPIFLVHRWRGKKLEDYTLSEKNMKKMREKNNARK